MKVSDFIVDFLVENSVNTIFGYPGGNVTHILDSINKKRDKIKYLQGYHEQASAFAAVGYSMVSGKVGVALSSSGPGATNMITAIADAWFDSVPCLFLCGQVSMHDQRNNDNLRQNGFQEVDIVSLVSSITKYAVRVTDENEISYHLEKALHYAFEGRKGPVLVELPHSIQAKDVKENDLVHFVIEESESSEDVSETILSLEKLINEAERPIIFAGAGVRQAGCADQVLVLSKRLHIPIVTSLMGIDLFDRREENVVGFVGPCGSPRANYAVGNCDLLIALGVRLEGQHTGKPETFAPEARVIHIDIDRSELENFPRSVKKIHADIQTVVGMCLKNLRVQEDNKRKREVWLEEIAGLREYYGNSIQAGDNAIDPNALLTAVGDCLDDKAIVCVDVGQHLLWAAQSIRYSLGGRFLASGGLGSMGFALPACIGAYYAAPDSVPVVIVGDGGLQMNIQELQTIVKYNLPVTIIVLNNHSLGMVRAYQDRWFKHQLGSVDEYLPIPSYEKIAKAYDMLYYRITGEDEAKDIKNYIFEKKAKIVEVVIPDNSIVYSGLKEYEEE